jgi:hypothetical protein
MTTTTTMVIIIDMGNGIGGGIVHRMVWSPTSQRLAVSFMPGTPACDTIALFATQPGSSSPLLSALKINISAIINHLDQ